MRKAFLLLSLISFLGYSSFAQQNQITTIYFESNQSDLSEVAQNKINEILASLQNNKTLKISIKAHTDSDGSTSYNHQLSTQRADKTLNYLTSKGINRSSIQIEPIGENQPIASNDNSKGKANNRRVEIMFTYETLVLPLKVRKEGISHQEVEAMEVPSNDIPIEKKPIKAKQTLKEKFQVPTKTQTIDPTTENTLTLDEKGTKLYIPANSLIRQNGEPVTETVTIHYKEYRNSADMVFSDIPMTYTQDGEEFLFNSAGMFEIQGTIGEEPVDVKEGQILQMDYGLARQNFDADFYELDETGTSWTKIQEIKTSDEIKPRSNGWFTDESDFYKSYHLSSARGRIKRFQELRIKINLAEEDTTITVIYGEEIIVDGMIINDKFQGTIKRKWKKKERLIELQENVDGYFQNTWNRIQTAELNNERVVRGLALKGFGVYNCDQIYRIKSPVRILAVCVDESGNEIQNFAGLSMIDLKYNAAFQFYNKSFRARKAGSIALVLKTTDAKLYVLTGEDYKAMKIRESGEYTFKFKDMTEQLKSADDLAKYLKL